MPPWLLQHADMAEIDLNEALEPLTLADPVEAMHTVSHDLTLAAPLPLETGGTTTAWQMQVTLRGLVYAAAATVYGTDTSGEPAWPDRSTLRHHGDVGAGLSPTSPPYAMPTMTDD